MRRLYSTFAGGWPGIGLLLMRLVVGAVVLWHVGPRLWSGPPLHTGVGYALLALGGLLLIAGLWTPVAGVMVAAVAMSEISRQANLPPGAFSPQPSPARWRCSDPAGCQSMLGSSDGSASMRRCARNNSTSAEPEAPRPKGSRHATLPSLSSHPSKSSEAISRVVATHSSKPSRSRPMSRRMRPNGGCGRRRGAPRIAETGGLSQCWLWKKALPTVRIFRAHISRLAGTAPRARRHE